jgi:hypothetical protein
LIFVSLRTFYGAFIQSFRLCVSNTRDGQKIGPKKAAGFMETNSMWTHEVAPERLAELFHHYHQALTPEVSGKGSESPSSWKEVSPQVKSRLVAAARLALLELESLTNERAKVRQYFAQPGEAEWGC